MRAPRCQRVAHASKVVMSDDDSARGQLAASWNQHCAPPWLTPECSTNSAPGALPGSGFAAPLATWLPSSQTSTPLPGVLRMMTECVCRRSSDDVSTRMAAAGEQHQAIAGTSHAVRLQDGCAASD